jgi:hypothetical protein
VRWAGARPAHAPKDKRWLYGVDSGTAAFLSVEAADAIEKAGESFRDALSAAINKTVTRSWHWANVPVLSGSPLNVVAFSSGYGDGSHLSDVAYDSAGRPLGLVTAVVGGDSKTAET